MGCARGGRDRWGRPTPRGRRPGARRNACNQLPRAFCKIRRRVAGCSVMRRVPARLARPEGIIWCLRVGVGILVHAVDPEGDENFWWSYL